MLQTQQQEYQTEIENLTQELNETKRKYFAYKKKEYDETVKRSEEQLSHGFAAPNA